MVIFAVVLAAGAAAGMALLAVERWRMRTPPLTEWQKRRPYLNARQGAPETIERIETTQELAEREATLVRRERIVEGAMADAQRRFAEATALIEAHEAALASREAELQQQEDALADRQRSLAAHESVPARDRGARSVDSDWWDKQLGPRRSTEE